MTYKEIILNRILDKKTIVEIQSWWADTHVPDYHLNLDDEDDTYFYVYLSDMEKYWIEEYGQGSWDNVSFEDIDMEIQTNNPELWYVGNGSNDRGEYFSYTTDERQAYK